MIGEYSGTFQILRIKLRFNTIYYLCYFTKLQMAFLGFFFGGFGGPEAHFRDPEELLEVLSIGLLQQLLGKSRPPADYY